MSPTILVGGRTYNLRATDETGQVACEMLGKTKYLGGFEANTTTEDGVVTFSSLNGPDYGIDVKRTLPGVGYDFVFTSFTCK